MSSFNFSCAEELYCEAVKLILTISHASCLNIQANWLCFTVAYH